MLQPGSEERTGQGRILLVDDEPLNRDMLARRLERKGFTVQPVASGREALEQIAREEFDLVLLDSMMPEMSGLQTLKRIREQSCSSSLPVIMVTAVTDSASVVEALENGANDYVTKPVDFPVALVRIRNHLARRQAEQVLRESEERYALAMQGANDGLWDWDFRTGQVYYSPRWKSMLGLAENEASATPEEWLSRVHPEDKAALLALLEAVRAGDRPILETEHRLEHRDGGYVWVLARGVSRRSEAGDIVRLAGSLTDITGSKAFDALTGLPNRVLFLDRVQKALERRRSSGVRFAVLFLDLDRFKLVNDSLGHMAGDRLLQEVAQKLRNSVRGGASAGQQDGDHIVARFGGDEFAILVENLRRPEDACKVGDRILEELHQPINLLGRGMLPTVSIGIACDSDHYSAAEEILRDADTALYEAKARGKARYEVFTEAMREATVARLEVENELSRAMELNEFQLYYQPKVELQSGRMVGFEALIRWCHPTQGIILPGRFIQVAEDTGQIVPIGEWVLQEACTKLKEWQDKYGLDRSFCVSVNVSSRQLAQSRFVERLKEILDQTQLPPCCLELELTESVLLQETNTTIEALEGIRRLGVGLKIDDFGTGYSSLSYLHRLPFDMIKIDRSFIQRIANKPSSEPMIRTILSLAKGLGLEVVAEGIEDPQQLECLRELGCQFGQGYYFGRPLDKDTAEDLLANPRQRIEPHLELAG